MAAWNDTVENNINVILTLSINAASSLHYITCHLDVITVCELITKYDLNVLHIFFVFIRKTFCFDFFIGDIFVLRDTEEPTAE